MNTYTAIIKKSLIKRWKILEVGELRPAGLNCCLPNTGITNVRHYIQQAVFVVAVIFMVTLVILFSLSNFGFEGDFANLIEIKIQI